MTVGVPERLLEPFLDHVADEERRLPEQVQSRAVVDLDAVGARVDGDATEHELGVQAVAALLQVAAIRHLCQQVRRAQQVPHDAVARVVHADLVERHLVARVMHDTGGDRYPVGKAHGRQVAGDEFRAAGDVIAREHGAVGHLGLRGLADVAGVVEQRRHQAYQRTLRPQPAALRRGPLVAREQAGGGQHDVERVLQVMVDGVHADVPGHRAREQPGEIVDGAAGRIEVGAGPRRGVQLEHGVAHGLRRTHLDAVGDVIVAAAVRARHIRSRATRGA